MDWIRYIHRRTLWLLAAATALVAVLAGYHLAVQRPQEKALRDRIATLQRDHRNTPLPEDSRMATFDATASDLRAFRTFLPPRQELPQLIAELYQAAEEARLGIDHINYSPEPLPRFGMYRYELRFSVSGPYPNLRRLIQRMEASERILGLKSIRMTEGTQGGGVSLALVVETYFRTDAP